MLTIKRYAYYIDVNQSILKRQYKRHFKYSCAPLSDCLIENMTLYFIIINP